MADYSSSELDPARLYLNQIADFLTENPHAWTRGQFAVDAAGYPCDPRSAEARKWCAIGLLQKFVPAGMVRRCEQLLSSAITPRRSRQEISAANFNDNQARSVDDVVAMFRSAALATRLEVPMRCSCSLCRCEELALKVTFGQVPDWLQMAGVEWSIPKEEAVAA